MTVKMDFSRSLLSIAITAITVLSFSSASNAQCSGSPASEGGDIVISVAGETCDAASVDASPDQDGNGRVGNISVEGTIDSTGDGAALYIDAIGKFDDNAPNIGNIINSGTIRSAQKGIQIGGEDQSASGIIGNIINAGEIYSVNDGIEVELDGNGQVGTIENQNKIESSSHFGLFVNTYGNSSVQDVINSGTIKSGYDDDAFKVYARENSTVGNVINSGDIQSGYWGLVIQTNDLRYDDETWDDGNAVVGNVTNSGTINADQDALYVFAKRGTIGDVLNSGTLISQRDYGLYVRSDDEGTVGTVTNTGSITSVSDDAVGISGNAHTFINSGTITSASGDAVEVYGDSNQLINSGTMTGLVSFNGQDNTFILTGGLVNGNVEGVSTINVTGSAELTGSISSSNAGILNIYDNGNLIVGGSGDVVYDTHLNYQGQMTVRLGAENNLNNEGATARLTLLSQVVPQMDEPVNLSSSAISFADGASVLVTPDYDGDFAYGDTEQYRVLSAGSGIAGTPVVSSASILYTVDDASVLDSQHLDVTVSTTDLTAVVEENTSDALVTQVAGFLESYLGGLNQQAAADFIDSEQLLTVSDADGLIDYLQQQYPNGDTASLAAVAAAVEQMQGEVFNNLLTRLASLRDGGRSGVSSGDLVEQGAVWLKAIGAEADQNPQSSNAPVTMVIKVV